MTTRFIVVRHGETEWNVEARVQGHRDSPLTAAGRAQAEALAARLAAEPFDAIVSSDLGRAFETARPIAARRGLAVRRDERLRERSFGHGEGLTYDELDRRWPGVFPRSGPSDPDAPMPGGETRRQFHGRVRDAFHDLARAHDGLRLAVVCHGGVLAALYRIVMGIPVDEARRVAISNASYNAVAFDAGAWALEAWDDTAHLGAAEPFSEA